MKALDKYLERANSWCSFTKIKPLTLDTREDRQKVADRISSDLSPENLSCDGEASAAHIRETRKLLTAARKELVKLDSGVTFSEEYC